MGSWSFYSSNEIAPDGWLKRQLELQADGLCGNLDKIWPDIRDSAWIGGDREGWERVPYWLDGFIPLAYLLNDEDKIKRARRYIDAILKRQRADGWICPCSDEDISKYDTWAVLLISKVLVVYYNCYHDERIPDVLFKMMKNYYELLSNGKIKLFEWGKYRWFEGFIALNFLSERYSDAWISELGSILREQGYDYSTDEATELWKHPLNKWTFDTHVVNIAMMLKSEAVSHTLLDEEYTDSAEKLWQLLTKYNGTPVGILTGDECLSGLSSIQGTELCSIAELMYSFELLYAKTGDRKWAERLEKVAFNALPATISDDMWTHQYVQMSNQINCRRFPGRSLFRTNNHEAHLFGLEPNFGCCTANFAQAWPKLALSAFMHRGNCVLSALPIPSKLVSNGINIELKTDYPFENTLTYSVLSEKDFELIVRVPSFAENLKVNGNTAENCGYITFPIKSGEKQEICIAFDTIPRMVDRPYGLKSVECGSLVFSLPINYEKQMYEYEKDGVERKYPYCDYEYIGTSEWRYGFSNTVLERNFNGVDNCPFSSKKPAVTVKAELKRIPWEFEDGFDTVSAKNPSDRHPCGQAETVDLYPYSCAKLRVTELPICEE